MFLAFLFFTEQKEGRKENISLSDIRLSQHFAVANRKVGIIGCKVIGG